MANRKHRKGFNIRAKTPSHVPGAKAAQRFLRSKGGATPPGAPPGDRNAGSKVKQ